MIHTGDVIEVLSRLEPDQFDAVLCDPPYGLRFMGKRWDYDVPGPEHWRAIARVLKPGAPMLACGGTRTVHRLVCAIEDAGFEIRDQLVYLYGKGFPKSQRADLAVDAALGVEHITTGERTIFGSAGTPTSEKGGTYVVGVRSAGSVVVPTKAAGSHIGARYAGYGTALKPAHEPIVLARKPLIGTLGANLLAHGTEALNIDGARLGGDDEDAIRSASARGTSRKPSLNLGSAYNYIGTVTGGTGSPLGRWPANVILDAEAGEALDEAVGPRDSNPFRANEAPGAVFPMRPRSAGGQRERGLGPSRFFYCAKVSTRERELGCEALPRRTAGEVTGRDDDTAGLDSPRAGAGRVGGARNHHPTLKPLALTEYLARLLLPPAGRVRRILVPYAGAGSEMIGAYRAGWDEVDGVERDAEYVAIAEARIKAWDRSRGT